MAFRFEELKIWRQVFALSNQIDVMVRSFPKYEMYSLSSQIKRASDSVENEFQKYYNEYEILTKMVTKFRNSIHPNPMSH